MFRIVCRQTRTEIRRGKFESLRGVIEAARWMGAIVQQWDSGTGIWREI